MSTIVQLFADQAALLVAILALTVSLVANHTARQAHCFTLLTRKVDERARFAEKKRETLNELDVQYTRMATLSMITSQKILTFRDNPVLHQSMPEELARLKANLEVMERLRSRCEEHRNSVEEIGLDADLGRQEEMFANIRRMTIHVEKDIAHEQAGLDTILRGLAA